MTPKAMNYVSSLSNALHAKFSKSAVLVAELIHMECDLFAFNNMLFSPRKYHNKIKMATFQVAIN